MNSVNSDQEPTEQATSRSGFRARWRWPSVAAFALLCLPTAAVAQIADPGEQDPLYSGVATLLIAAIALIVIAWQRRQARRETMRADHFVARSSLLEAALDSAPWPHFGWTAQGTPVEDPQFAKALGRSDVATLDDLTAALAEGDGATLKTALQRLRAEGTPFDLTLQRTDHAEITLAGRRGLSIHGGQNGQQQVDLMWLVETDTSSGE